MKHVLVVDRTEYWPLHIPGLDVISARSYLDHDQNTDQGRCVVFNACRSYRYQSLGYYVSLLAVARGHRVLPDVATIQGIRSPAFRNLGEDVDALVTRSLQDIKSDRFQLSIYFGRNTAQRHARLAKALFNAFPAPFLQAHFRRRDRHWELTRLKLLSGGEIPDGHHDFVREAAQHFFRTRNGGGNRRRQNYRYDLAILIDSNEQEPPSDEDALKRFAQAAKRAGLRPTFIEKDDFGRLSAFDALLIRTTTYVDHYTYRFAQRAQSEGIAVIDDPDSIIRCTNKVFLAELLQRHKVPTPDTMVVHRENQDQVATRMGFPCVLKKPDSGFSQGVYLVADEAELKRQLANMFAGSDLLIAQAFMPSDFDWRIGIIDRQPLFACRYHMAPGHWQIISHDEDGKVVDMGNHDTLAIESVPESVMRAALKAANLIGDGLYGVDLKEIEGRVQVIEVNDNPNIDGNVEDAVIGMHCYDRVMSSLLRRIEHLRQGWSA